MEQHLTKKQKRRITFFSILSILIIWKGASMVTGSQFILPAPEKVVVDFINMLVTGSFYISISVTVLRGIAGFVIAFILALLLGILAGISPVFRTWFTPFLVIIRSTPVISVILLALIWFHTDTVPVFIAILTMFPILCNNIMDGISTVDQGLVEMANTYKVSNYRVIKEVYLPGTLPFLFSGVSSAMGFGWRAVIIGEVLAQPLHGIGTGMQLAQTYLMVSKVISWTVVAVLISMVFEKLIRRVESRVVVWN
ncbi:MAG TPA: ABC transporter permease subunit [Bacteroidales bacterium]|nr:ABC transporter permease subunit [Bacteroidales bacterium]